MASKNKKTPDKSGGGNDLIERFKANPFVFIGTFLILIIVVIAFVLLPALTPASQRAAGDLTFGFYNKIPISYVPDNLFHRWQETLARRYQQFINDDNYMWVYRQIWQQAYEEIVIHTGKLDEMKRAGYRVPVDKVEREVARLPQFQENGNFSISLYSRESQSSRNNLLRFMGESIVTDHYASDFAGLGPSANETAFAGSMAFPQRSFDMVSFSVSSYPDEEIIAYAEENQELFMVTYLSRITITSSERDARNVLASVQDGVLSFEDAAIANSQDFNADRGGDMGSRLAYELEMIIPGTADRETVAGLRQGEISSVMQVGEKSWAFFRAEENPHPAETSDPVMLERIRSYVFSYERGRAEDWATSQAEAFISTASAGSFSAAARDNSMTVQNFGPVPVNYGDIDLFPTLSSFDVTELQGASRNEIFWRAAFHTPIMTPSSPVVLGNNVVVLLPYEEILSPPDSNRLVESYFEDEVHRLTEDAIRNYFLNNSKHDNRFDFVFSTNWGF